MRVTTTLIPSLLAVLLLAAGASAQCNAPGLEDFETGTTNGSTSTACGPIPPTISPGTLPPGWMTDLTVSNVWRVDTGGTPSGSTGPAVDHTLGTSTGHYLYVEASGACYTTGSTAIIQGPCVDPTGLTTPAVEFWYHMYGQSMGTLVLEIFDGAMWQQAVTLTGQQQAAQSDPWLFAQFAIPSTWISGAGNQIQFRFRGVVGTNFYSDMAIDDIFVGEYTVPSYETNEPEGSLDIDGVQGLAFGPPATVNLTGWNCFVVAPATGTLTLSSTLVGNGYEVLLSGAALVPLGGGGFGLPGAPGTADEIVNINFGAPLSFMNGGLVPSFDPLPSYPGASEVSVVVPFAIGTSTSLSLQGAILNPAALGGFELTQATALNVTINSPINTLPGPTGDDTSVTIDPVSPPSCWTASGVSLYGTTYSTFEVSSNGRVTMGPNDDIDWTPTTIEAIYDNPMVGFWTDLDPSAGGLITVSDVGAGVVRVDWIGVPYQGQPGTMNSFAIEFDSVAGTVLLTGLNGIGANPASTGPADNQFLGISPGNSLATTNPGAVTFTSGGSGGAAAATHMLYDFYNFAAGGGLAPSLVGGTLTSVLFTPSGGNYTWSGL